MPDEIQTNAEKAQLDLASFLPRFGLSTFRPGQEEVISAVVSGQDCLCVMPTGGGKSLCYQLPAIACPGLTLVVSPLIALMQDQVQQLERLDIRATFINSTLDGVAQQERITRMAAGEYDLVYVAAERFRSPRFREALRKTQINVLAIDEAHCISEWGHDFRPDYSKLGRARQQVGNPTTIALTATATDSVRRDIAAQLNLRDPATIITGFQRPNLRYEVQSQGRDQDKIEALIRLLRETSGSGIIYVATRKKCAEVAEILAERTDRRVGTYNAGMMNEDRRKAQDDFMSGKKELVVATNAFGMGIDKADVRFVIHYNLPGTLEAYYQEAGRAGRDGDPSRCLLLFATRDLYIQEYFIDSRFPDRSTVAQIYDFLRQLDADPIELTQQEIKESLNLSIGVDGVRTSERLLEKAGVLERLEPSQNMAIARISNDLPSLVDLLPRQAKMQRKVLRVIEAFIGDRRHELVYFHPRKLAEQTGIEAAVFARGLNELRNLNDFEYVPPFRGRAVHMMDRNKPFEKLNIDFDELEQRKAYDYEKLNKMVAYARSQNCRQQAILHYFGQEDNPPCRRCDNCDSSGRSEADVSVADDAAVLTSVRMILSGVARTRGRFGRNILAQMMCGSQAAAITKFRLDRLSTYGLMSHLKQSDVLKLIDALIEAGYLEQMDRERFRPVVGLTDRGEQTMRGHAGLTSELFLPEELIVILNETESAPETSDNGRPDRSAEGERQQGPLDETLLKALRDWRKETAAKENIANFMVLPNRTLEEIARRRPQTSDALLEVNGIGQGKLAKYGDALLSRTKQNAAVPAPDATAAPAPPMDDAVAAATGSTNALDQPDAAISPDLSDESGTKLADEPVDYVQLDEGGSPRVATRTEGPPGQPNHYWTWRLLQAGFSAEECSIIRSLDPDVIFDHALRAAEDGRTVDARAFLSAEKIAALQKVIGPEPPRRIRPLLSRLPRGTRYEEVQLFLACRVAAMEKPE